MSEISQAFDHPEARSIATADTYLDRISLRDHIVSVEIGAFQAERGVTQRISFNVVVEVRPSSGAETDDVDDILSYDRLAWAIATELEADRLNLLETLAERVALRILAEPQAVRVFLRIEKLDKDAGKLGVEIMRSLNDVSNASHDTQNVANVTVAHLTSEYLAQADLGVLIKQIQAFSGPVLLTVASTADEFADAGQVPARRQALLEIEKTAWGLAQQNAAFVPVATWTELDWGLKNDQISVWAPSKLIFDSPDPSVGQLRSAEVISQWLAVQLDARHVTLSHSSDTLM